MMCCGWRIGDFQPRPVHFDLESVHLERFRSAASSTASPPRPAIRLPADFSAGTYIMMSISMGLVGPGLVSQDSFVLPSTITWSQRRLIMVPYFHGTNLRS